MSWCLHKARLFLIGCPNLLGVMEHQPLVGLYKDRSLAEVINRSQLFLKEKMLPYWLMIKYTPGKQNNVADTLSQFPALMASSNEDDMD